MTRSYQAPLPDQPATSQKNVDVQSDQVIGPDGTVYLSTFAGFLLALADAPNGKLAPKWQFQVAKS
ncbi:MAG TPA: hypothetical protein VKU60_15390, partial [Chloroflexota bacterium]|nr:hypothetical protein [Chloroflexota bacterium]